LQNQTPTPCGPLDGVRVLDLSSVVLGPMGTQVLADMGADVIKVEAPSGDMMRANGTVTHAGMSSIFVAINRNKRSIVLDLKLDEDRSVLRQLIKTADVLVHNMRVPAIERLGFGYQEVTGIQPNIVYCAATGFGQDGPDREKPAFDDIIQAGSGLVGANAVGHPAPDYLPSLIADKTAGLAVANAILGALFYRERHGKGQYVEVPMLETMAAFVLAEHMGGMAFPGSAAPAGYQRLLEGGRKPLRTADGWISMLPYTEKHWDAFFREVGRDDLAERYDIADRIERNRYIKEIYAHLHEIALTRTTAQWMETCERLDIPATPIYTLDELPEHPHLKAVGLFQTSEHPLLGTIRQVRPAARYSLTPLSIRRPAPTLGQDTEAVLRELGMAEAEIQRVSGKRAGS